MIQWLWSLFNCFERSSGGTQETQGTQGGTRTKNTLPLSLGASIASLCSCPLPLSPLFILPKKLKKDFNADNNKILTGKQGDERVPRTLVWRTTSRSLHDR